MSDTADRQNDIMNMLISLQISLIGVAFRDLFFIFFSLGVVFTLAVYTRTVRAQPAKHVDAVTASFALVGFDEPAHREPPSSRSVSGCSDRIPILV
jgi:hypothetical protein